MGKQPDELIFAAFVRSLTPEQRTTPAGVMELVDRGEASRLF